MAKDYYKILGVSKDASDEDIKKAYRRLAHQHHPDKAGGNEAKFKEINEAYQILSNRDKRAQYDRFGQAFQGGTPPWGQGGFGGEGMRWDAGFGDDFSDFGDIFESIFGSFGGRRRQTYTHGSDIEVAVELTLEQSFRGTKYKVGVRTNISCRACQGLGYEKSKGLTACTVCQGRGEIREQKKTFFGNFSQVRVCPSCDGRGQIPNHPCGQCKGHGRVMGVHDVVIDIASGVEDGQIIKVTGGGEVGERGSASGDLYVVVKIKTHPIFERRKHDLAMVKDIRLTEAFLGKKIELEDLSGEKFHVKIPNGFNLREPFKVSGRGMPRFGLGSGSGRGDLFVTFNLKVPHTLSAHAKKLLEGLDGEL
ncbi:molecular chaperone DnaJ [Candidatus Jorgensenbacteria bacterium]|nr:molecular chaperone DnaJ [Candidatus Jorgensenbacteria bacterium]